MELMNTIDVLCRQVELAEVAVRRAVNKRMPDASEEQITTLFQEHLSGQIESASDDGEFVNAFGSDLSIAGMPRTADRISSGFIAKVSFHSRSVESSTGGDFGLVLVRPKVSRQDDGLRIDLEGAVGLLAQAKKRRCYGSAGSFTKKQKSLFESQKKYSSVVLYQFSDVENRVLDPFAWAYCNGHRCDELSSAIENGTCKWLRTADVLRALDQEAEGTSDSDVIQNVVSPPKSSVLKIELTWEEGMRPSTGSFVYIEPNDRLRSLR